MNRIRGNRAPWRGSSLAIAAAAALGVGSLVGSTLFESSVGSAAVQAQLDATCATDSGVTLYVTDGTAERRAVDAAAATGHTEAPIVGTQTPLVGFDVADADPSRHGRMSLLSRQGQFDDLGVDAPGAGDVLLPDWYVGDGTVVVGESVEIDLGDRVRVLNDDGQLDWIDLSALGPVALTVSGTYPAIPTRPEPSFWCGLRDQLRPSAQGDLPPPIGLVSDATMSALPTALATTTVEIRPDAAGLTIDRGAALESDLAAIVGTTYADRSEQIDVTKAQNDAVRSLHTLVARARSSAAYVHHTVLPVQLAGLLASIGLMVAAAALVVRERRSDLTLRAIRGCGPWQMTRSVAVPLAAATAAGTALGAIGAWALVVRFGPSPSVDSSAFARAAIIGTLGAAMLLGVSMAIVARRSSDLVDATPRTRRTVFGPELIVVALAVASYLRLDEVGGARRVGQDVVGGDVLAQAFPLLAALAAVAIAVRPTSWLLRHLRGRSRSLPTPIHMGWSRFVAEPALSVLLIASTSLAVSFAVQATSLATTFQQSLDDKAGLFVGADLVIDVVDEPGAVADLGAAATVTSRASIAGVDVLGVDADTFAAVAFWRADASPNSLPALLDQLRTTGGDGTPAIVVGDEPVSNDIDLRGHVLTIDPVAHLDFFPTYATGKTLIVVERSALQALGRSATEVWVRDPTDDAVDRLVGSGTRVRFADTPAEVFGVTDFLLTRWGYWPYLALGVVMAGATVVAQTLTFGTRKRAREQAYVLSRPMGMRLGQHGLAAAIETSLPLVVGIVYGVVIGVGATRLAADRLDSLRRAQPPVAMHVDTAAIGVAAIGTVGLIVAFTLVATVSLRRTDPMRTMRALTQ